MSKPKSRRIPKPIWFTVAAVLMVVLWVFLAVWLPYHREQVAIREIERLGGGVAIFWDGPEWMWDGSEWLQKKVYDGWLSWFSRRACPALLVSRKVSRDKSRGYWISGR